VIRVLYPMPCVVCGCVYTVTADELLRLLTDEGVFFVCRNYCNEHLCDCRRLITEGRHES